MIRPYFGQRPSPTNPNYNELPEDIGGLSGGGVAAALSGRGVKISWHITNGDEVQYFVVTRIGPGARDSTVVDGNVLATYAPHVYSTIDSEIFSVGTYTYAVWYHSYSYGDHFLDQARFAIDPSVSMSISWALAGDVKGTAADVWWTVANASNVAGFFVERRDDGASNWRPMTSMIPFDSNRTYHVWDSSVQNAHTYVYRLSCASTIGGTSLWLDSVTVRVVIDEVGSTPFPESDALWLGANIPNPFTSATSIPFRAPAQTDARIVVFDILGREVRVLAGARAAPSVHATVAWDGRDAGGNLVPAGQYLVRLTSGRASVARIVTRAR
jgi:hypothetical protein